MKFFAILLLAGTALAQQSASVTPNSSAPAQLPIKTGEWKLTAVVHGKDGDHTQTFFSCIKQSDLAKLVQQPDMPKTVTCTEDPAQVTAQGLKLAMSCKSDSAVAHTTYDLTRNSDTMVTGTMNWALDLNGAHTESNTSIIFQWQADACTAPESQQPAAVTPATPASPSK
jgi:hypothetical protein